MKNSARITVAGLVSERLATLGAANIPANAREIIETDVWAAVAALIQRRISAPVVGRAVVRALATPEGSKGACAPLASSEEPSVTGQTPLPATVEAAVTSGAPGQLPAWERL